MDEQIFAIQPYGGISRLFAELARQFTGGVAPDLELLPIDAPIVCRYVLDDPALSSSLGVREARSEWSALGRYFGRPRVHPKSDILHNTFYLPHGLTPTRGAKRIVTVYDMIPERLPKTRRRLDLLTLKRRYVEQADHIICISEATHRDLVAVYGELDRPVTVVHLGVDPRFNPSVARLPILPERYVLMVGHRGQYKDGDVLLRAFARVFREFPDVQLVCIGGGDWSRDERALIRELGLEEHVLQVGLSDELMPAAYAGAEAFVFPSRFEGFGLPAVEAMACGTPTILADATSLPEVGGDAARYFPVGDDEALASAIRSVLADAGAAADLRERGISRAATFTWTRTAEQTADVYRRTLDR